MVKIQGENKVGKYREKIQGENEGENKERKYREKIQGENRGRK